MKEKNDSDGTINLAFYIRRIIVSGAKVGFNDFYCKVANNITRITSIDVILVIHAISFFRERRRGRERERGGGGREGGAEDPTSKTKKSINLSVLTVW